MSQPDSHARFEEITLPAMFLRTAARRPEREALRPAIPPKVDSARTVGEVNFQRHTHGGHGVKQVLGMRRGRIINQL